MPTSAINNILYGGPIENPVTKYAKSAGEFLLDCFRKLGNDIVLVDGLTGVEVSASEFCEKIINFARCLQALGIREGDVVELCCENRLEFIYTMFGTSLINATVAPCSAMYTERELSHALLITKPKVIFASKRTIKNVAKVAQKHSFVKYIICFDDTPTRGITTYTKFNSLYKGKKSAVFKVKPADKSGNLMLVLYSSGTTGLPKGVELTQENVLALINISYERSKALAGATILSVIPWFHAYGYLSMLTFATVGAKYVFLEKFQEHHFLNCIQHYKVDICLMVPPLMVFLAKHPMIDQYDLSSLKMLLCGAASLSKETMEAVQNRIGVPLIRQAYGLTESTLGVLAQTDESAKPGSVGTVRQGVYCKVVDPETGKPLGPHQRGELCFKGPLIMRGYAGDPKSTAETIDRDGWLHTGDVGYYDEDFDFFIVDRIKELIKYKAFQVPPAEIEALLLTNPKIKDAAVVGLPDEVAGELPIAFVVKQPGTNLTAKDVIDFVAERASPAKRLHGGVQFVDEIPKNPSGKILRRVLKDRIMKQLKSKL